MADRVAISSGALTAQVDPLGAELVSLTDATGRELLTGADPAFWTGHAPLLFPVVGACAGDTIRVDGQPYPMAKHGFARRSTFALAKQAPDRVTFALTDTAATRACYPFAFVLRVSYELAGATLRVVAEIANPGAERELLASFGFHPAFAWPLPFGQARADHAIVFDSAEDAGIRLLAADGTITPGTRASPLDGRTLRLADELFAADALIWDPVRSQRVSYGAPAGPRLHVAFPDTPMLGVWTKPGSAFVCIEPWHGIADPTGYGGEFRDKPGVFAVAPGEAKRMELRMTLEG